MKNPIKKIVIAIVAVTFIFSIFILINSLSNKPVNNITCYNHGGRVCSTEKNLFLHWNGAHWTDVTKTVKLEISNVVLTKNLDKVV